ncbi:transglutaminase TgpA family protein [Pseudomonas mangrovi]|uniref:DUF3488 domain-containing protein n=1 Tax=Pseudomonas mangrovi TaxID=2161748 RepID=A0A2T5P7E0_9PSED|nr:DUF3488 and transglutaminase-like domain-containing protein [Pseudomonas mangrovi]PTU73627.1 DUF3488 domain-containing protein [Pseudomonas mangrovi]
MTPTPGIPRAALSWLLVAQALVIVPHLGHLPIWIVLLWLGCALWRIQIFRMRAAYPNALVKIVLMLIAGFAVYQSRGRLIGLDAGVVLLVAAFILKLVEMRSRRDALVLIFLGFFVVVTAYLFETGPGIALFSLLPVAVLLAAMIGLQSEGQAAKPWPTLRLAGGIMLQALPLMLLLFVFFPRMGPLWSLPTPSDRGKTGLSESMSPNDIAELSRSDELVFRATFAGTPPPRAELYWRAMTLEHFDGRRWSQAATPASRVDWQKRGEPLRYSVLMQPSEQAWLFALDVAESDEAGVYRMSDYRLQRERPIDRPLLYDVISWPEAVRDSSLSPWQLRRALQLPSQGEARSRLWAQQLRKAYPEPEALVNEVLANFNREPFVYTLRPPVLGENAIDTFLFDTRRGFCAHYAGAMVFVLRAAGIPARVVAGYQGGEPGPGARTVQVRQFDAHAWVEYWHPQRGWISVDPTFQVAPERIELGLEAAVAEEQSFLEDSPFSPLRYRQYGWLNQLRLALDELDHGWQNWVLNYQATQQQGLFERLLGKDFQWRLVLALLIGGGLFLGALALLLLKPWRDGLDPAQRLHAQFERILARQGLRRLPGEGARSFADRAARELPAQAAQIRAFSGLYQAQCYAGRSVAPSVLRHSLKRLRRALPWRLPGRGGK